MAIGPNDAVMAVASEATRLESEFDKAIARHINFTNQLGQIAISISTQVIPHLLNEVSTEIKNRYERAGWTEAVLLRRDDSSLTLELYTIEDKKSNHAFVEDTWTGLTKDKVY